MDGTLVVSIVAVLISALSLTVAVRADRRAARAETRGLRAQLVLELVGTSVEASGRRFDLDLRNVGEGVAERVRVSLVNESGDVVAAIPRAGTTVAPGEDPVTISLVVPEAALPPPPVPFAVWVAWSDAAGEHSRRPAGITVST